MRINYHHVSDESLKKFKEICEKEGIEYDTEEEYRQSAQNLVNLYDTLFQMAMDEKKREDRLVDEPKGFAMAGEGRNCSLCKQSVYDSDGWYDKWGFKCMNCQDAVNKKRIPGSLCRDSKNEKYITESSLSWRSGLHTQTIRKLIRQGKIKVRQIPNGPNLILRKDNPELLEIIKNERPH